ncbi:hypothetical protein EV14_1060 [Prochlorococcus sp. MIT 0703]|nr:hypothetical protein EV14_1060 [Prochlorococcus sp. MIT 0703]
MICSISPSQGAEELICSISPSQRAAISNLKCSTTAIQA